MAAAWFQFLKLILLHYTTGSLISGVMGQLSMADKQILLEKHNSLRGMVNPTASNMWAMVSYLVLFGLYSIFTKLHHSVGSKMKAVLYIYCRGGTMSWLKLLKPTLRIVSLNVTQIIKAQNLVVLGRIFLPVHRVLGT